MVKTKKILIEIPEEHYNDMKSSPVHWSGMKSCILNGTILSDDANDDFEIRDLKLQIASKDQAVEDIIEEMKRRIENVCNDVHKKLSKHYCCRCV